MAVNPLGALASTAAVPVFAAVGAGARHRVAELALDHRLRFVGSPRHATVLLAAGGLPASMLEALARVHDQVPHPRATVWWTGNDNGIERIPAALSVSAGGDVAGAVAGTHRELCLGRRSSEGDILPDEPPAPWRGVGPHGQGGEGMMGGRPYGRPMAMTGADRDGLALDRLELRLGPFLPHFPPGLALDVVVQGGVVQQVGALPSPFDPGWEPPAGGPVGLPPASRFAAALSEPAPVAALEAARARNHFIWLAGFLALHGLGGLTRRALRLAVHTDAARIGSRRTRARDVAGLVRWLERTGALRWSTRGVGRLGAGEVGRLAGGPVARASGRAVDARIHDPAYHSLGFDVITHAPGDALARCRQRLAEARQALELAERAEALGTQRLPGPAVEAPGGPLTLESVAGSDPLLQLIPDVMVGAEWGEALTALVSLDLDLEPVSARAHAVP